MRMGRRKIRRKTTERRKGPLWSFTVANRQGRKVRGHFLSPGCAKSQSVSARGRMEDALALLSRSLPCTCKSVKSKKDKKNKILPSTRAGVPWSGSCARGLRAACAGMCSWASPGPRGTPVLVGWALISFKWLPGLSSTGGGASRFIAED